MSIEIARKFLVVNDTWRSLAQVALHLRDGLIADHAGLEVCVRLCNGSGSITIKGRPDGLTRSEFTSDVPQSEVEQILRTMCDGRVFEKTRYLVPHEEFTWSVDVYEGLLAGVVIAEIDLQAEDQQFSRPDWLGQEVTEDALYRKVNWLTLAERGR